MTIHDFYYMFNISDEERNTAIEQLMNFSPNPDAIEIVVFILASRLDKQAQEIEKLKDSLK
jgi:hypothetical protein